MEPEKLTRTCRLCGKNGPNFREIFRGKEKNEIAEKISKCLPILINSNDGLPGHICPLCFRALNASYKLLIKAIETDEKLRQRLSQGAVQSNDKKRKLKFSTTSTSTDPIEPGICGFCEISFDDRGSFDKHMEMCHQSEWFCDLCQRLFTSSDELLQHKHKAHYDSNRQPEFHDFDAIDIKEERISDSEESDVESLDFGTVEKEKAPRMSQKEGIEARVVKINCHICNISIDKAFMAEHKKIHEPFAVCCTKCEIEIPSAYDLIKHKREIHGRFSGRVIRYFCRVCNRMILDSQALKMHMNCDKPQHKCEWCNETFQVKTHLRLHQRIHGARKEKKHKCDKCNKLFAKFSNLKDHLEAVHESLPKYQCDLCSKTFRTRGNLQSHKTRHLNHTCQDCGEEFENTFSLNEHSKRVHNVNLPVKGTFSCDECGKEFFKYSRLEDHKNVHSGKQPQVCGTCHQTFRTYAARWAHEQRHKREALCCDYCQKKFFNKRHLINHIMRHLPTESWQYECQVCRAKFKRKEILKKHMEKFRGSCFYKGDNVNFPTNNIFTCDQRTLSGEFEF